jgi:hypothetical protein
MDILTALYEANVNARVNGMRNLLSKWRGMINEIGQTACTKI